MAVSPEAADGSRIVKDTIHRLSAEHTALFPDSLTDEELERIVSSTEPPATLSLGGLMDIATRPLAGTINVLAHVHPHIPNPHFHLRRAS